MPALASVLVALLVKLGLAVSLGTGVFRWLVAAALGVMAAAGIITGVVAGVAW